MLLNEGIKDVVSMAGGIIAWNGMSATGMPDSGMAYFSASHGPEEYIALSWILEDGSQRFYSLIESSEQNTDVKTLYRKLSDAEGHHKASLEVLYTEMTGKEKGEDFPWTIIGAKTEDKIMEGGMNIDKAVKWLEGKETKDALELLMSLEVNAYDLYIMVGRSIEEGASREVFLHLAEEEKQHLARLSEMLERLII